MNVLVLWEEARVPRENPHMNMENIQTQTQFRPMSFCHKATVKNINGAQ